VGPTPTNANNEVLCVNLPSNLSLFKSYNDRLTIKAEPQIFYASLNSSSIALGLVLDFTGGDGVLGGGTSNAIINAPIGSDLTVQAQITGVYNSMSTSSNPCSTASSPLVCQQACRGSFVSSACSCWPLAYFASPARPANMPVCGAQSTTQNPCLLYEVMPKTASCLQGQSSASLSAEQACETACPPACTLTRYLFTQSNNNQQCGCGDASTSGGSGETSIEISLGSYTYPLTTSFATMDWLGFMNSFGASLGTSSGSY